MQNPDFFHWFAKDQRNTLGRMVRRGCVGKWKLNYTSIYYIFPKK